MELGDWFQVVGLGVDIIGVFITVIVVSSIKSTLITWDMLEGKVETPKEKKIKRNAYIGFCVIILGFVLQIIGILI